MEEENAYKPTDESNSLHKDFSVDSKLQAHTNLKEPN
jgi:hypothetical protein